MNELETKVTRVREIMEHESIQAVRLRGMDWFAWATGGGSNVVNSTLGSGIAQVLITKNEAWILTQKSDEERLRMEEVPHYYAYFSGEWFDPQSVESFVTDRIEGRAGECKVASDRPERGENRLPIALEAAKLQFVPEEIHRYRECGRLAAHAVTECLKNATSAWTEHELAAAGAQALLRRGLHPLVILAAGEDRIFRHHNPVPTAQRLGDYAKLTVSARKFGLVSNLTRFIAFKDISASLRKSHDDLAQIEAVALDQSRPGVPLHDVFNHIVREYDRRGYPNQWRNFHQGGLTGYRSREVLAHSGAAERIGLYCATAWNPSLPGAKIEDTYLIHPEGQEILTFDAAWPTREIHGRIRPLVWEKST